MRKLLISAVSLAALTVGGMSLAQTQTQPQQPGTDQNAATTTMPKTTGQNTTTTQPPSTSQNQAQTQQPAPGSASLTVSGLEAGNVIMASNLIGSTVYSSANENVGSVNDVIFSKDGKIQAIIIGVGGFLGLGEKDVAVPLDRITFTRDENNNMKYTIAASRQDLEQAPAFDKTKMIVGGGGAPAPAPAPIGGTSSTGQ